MSEEQPTPQPHSRDIQGQPWPSISTGKEVLLPQPASRGKCQTSEGKKKLREKTLNMRNKIRQTTHVSSVEMEGRHSAL